MKHDFKAAQEWFEQHPLIHMDAPFPRAIRAALELAIRAQEPELMQARIEAAAKAMYQRMDRSLMGYESWKNMARIALKAADSVIDDGPSPTNVPSPMRDDGKVNEGSSQITQLPSAIVKKEQVTKTSESVIKVKIRPGATVSQDFRFYKWPEKDKDIVFDVEIKDGYGKCCLTAKGFGCHETVYGNGALCVKDEDLIPMTTK